ncbi:hypothetical protein EON66_04740, partial [archaeon]
MPLQVQSPAARAPQSSEAPGTLATPTKPDASAGTSPWATSSPPPPAPAASSAGGCATCPAAPSTTSRRAVLERLAELSPFKIHFPKVVTLTDFPDHLLQEFCTFLAQADVLNYASTCKGVHSLWQACALPMKHLTFAYPHQRVLPRPADACFWGQCAASTSTHGNPFASVCILQRNVLLAQEMMEAVGLHDSSAAVTTTLARTAARLRPVLARALQRARTPAVVPLDAEDQLAVDRGAVPPELVDRVEDAADEAREQTPDDALLMIVESLCNAMFTLTQCIHMNVFGCCQALEAMGKLRPLYCWLYKWTTSCEHVMLLR